MDLAQAQQRVYRLVTLATDQPNTPEGQNAAIAACRLIRECGLLVSKPGELYAPPLAPLAGAPAAPKRRRKRANAKALAEEAVAAADTVVGAVDAAGRVVSAFNGFSQILRGAR